MNQETRRALELAREALAMTDDQSFEKFESIDAINAALAAIVRDADAEPDGEYLDGAGKGRVAVHRKGIERARAVLALRQAPAAPVAPDRVTLPVNADQAALMVLTGMSWLKEHAPERLSPAPAAPVAQPLTKTEFARLWRERMGATRFSNYEWEAKQITELAHGIGQGGA